MYLSDERKYQKLSSEDRISLLQLELNFALDFAKLTKSKDDIDNLERVLKRKIFCSTNACV